MIAAQVFFIVLALVVSFVVLVVYGPGSAPLWLIYTSYPIMALGGGAAINLILTKM